MRLRADGTLRCQDCARLPVEGRARCKRCAKRHAIASAKRRATLINAGRCVVCGRKASAGMTICLEHRRYYAERAAAAT